MKKIMLIFGTVSILAVAGVLVLSRKLDLDKIQRMVEKRISALINGKVELGEIRFEGLNRLALYEVRLSVDEKICLEIPKVSLSLSLGALLEMRAEVSSLELHNPRIYAGERLKLLLAKPKVAEAGKSESEQTSVSDSSPMIPDLKQIRILKGLILVSEGVLQPLEIGFEAEGSVQSGQAYLKHLTLTPAKSTQVSLSGNLDLRTQKGQISFQDSYLDLPASLAYLTREVEISGKVTLRGTTKISPDQIKPEIMAEYSGGILKLSGQELAIGPTILKLEGDKIQGPLNLDYAGLQSKTQIELSFGKTLEYHIRGTLGTGSLQAQGDFPSDDPKKALFRSRFHIKNLSLNTLNSALPRLNLSSITLSPGGRLRAEVQGSKNTRLEFRSNLGFELEEILKSLTLKGNLLAQDFTSLLPSMKAYFPKGIITLEIEALKEKTLQSKVSAPMLALPLTSTIPDLKLKSVHVETSVDPLQRRLGPIEGRFEVFSGTASFTGKLDPEDLEATRLQAKIQNLALEPAVSHFAPAMKNHLSGALFGVLKNAKLLPAAVNAYPLEFEGHLKIEKGEYRYHQVILELIDGLQNRFKQGFVQNLLNQEKKDLKAREHKGVRFKDIPEIPFQFLGGVVKFPKIYLEEERSQFSVQISSLILELPTPEKPLGHIEGDSKIHLSNAFLKEKLPLKENFKKDIELKVELNGPLDAPLSDQAIQEARNRALKVLLPQLDLKKAGKSLEREGKKLISKFKDIKSLLKGKTTTATGKVEKEQSLIKNLLENKDEIKGLFKSLFR
jgi:hypothetical protein